MVLSGLSSNKTHLETPICLIIWFQLAGK
uniref:Uncharacterized protein n=1 Tax=Arundo donax TaxID=35708 RepID=A0A0A8ZYB6_ARUDO